VVLILAVFAAVLLSVLAVGVTAAVRVELLASRASLNRAQSLFLAEAGINMARALLYYDDPTIDVLQDPWGPQSELALDLPHEFGPGFFRVRVHDACGRVDVNEADHTTLSRLTGDPAVAAAIMDWRDRGPMTSPGGAEEDYYAGLGCPYSPRNGRFQSLGELLLVRGVTPEVFFGNEEQMGLVNLLTVDSVSSQVNPDGNSLVNLNSFLNWNDEGFQKNIMGKLGSIITMYEAEEIWYGLDNLMKRGQQGYTSLGQLLTEAHLSPDKVALLVDYVCVDTGQTARGKVNVNTASVEVLAALPGSSENIGEGILLRREEAPFERLSEVARVLLDQPNSELVFAQMIDRVTVKSSSFIVESMGWGLSERGFRTLRALVRRSEESVAVVRQVEQDWPLLPPEDSLLEAYY
jgi:type II secretory pathway component PulK